MREKIRRVVTVLLIMVITMLLISLSGCSSISRLVTYGAYANDEAVKSAVFTLCNGASIGSIKREFDTDKKLQTWRDLCDIKKLN